MDITGNSIKMFADNGSTVMTEWDNTTLTLGGATGADTDCLVLSSSGAKIYGSTNTNFVNIDSATVTIQSSADDSVAISASGIVLRAGGSDVMSLDAGNISMTGKVQVIGTDNNISIGDGQTDLGDDNVAIGHYAGRALAAGGDDNVLIGTSAGDDLATGSKNVLIGYGAGQYMTHDSNLAVGHLAGGKITSGENNVCLGRYAGYGGGNASESRSEGDENISIGYQAMYDVEGDQIMYVLAHVLGRIL